MRFTLAIPTSLYEAVYIPDNVKKIIQLKTILQNRGSYSECIHLLKYAYTRSVYENMILFTPQGNMIFPLYNKGSSVFAKCCPHQGCCEKPNQRFKLSSFFRENRLMLKKAARPQIIEQFFELDSLKIALGSFHTLCERNRTPIYGENYQERLNVLSECVHRSVRYAQEQPSIIQVDYYEGHQQLEIPYLDAKSRIQSNLFLVIRHENGKWIMPTVLPRKYIESNKKMILN
jgi:hypothetical protein